MVIFLIDQGAKVDIVDQQGQLALDIAKRGGLDGKENLKSELIKKIESKHQTTVQCTKLVARQDVAHGVYFAYQADLMQFDAQIDLLISF